MEKREVRDIVKSYLNKKKENPDVKLVFHTKIEDITGDFVDSLSKIKDLIRIVDESGNEYFITLENINLVKIINCNG